MATEGGAETRLDGTIVLGLAANCGQVRQVVHVVAIERLHVTSQTLRNYFRVAKEVCQHKHSTRSVVGVDATKHVQLPISSEPTGSTMVQSCCAYNCTARVVRETREGRNTVLSRS